MRVIMRSDCSADDNTGTGSEILRVLDGVIKVAVEPTIAMHQNRYMLFY